MSRVGKLPIILDTGVVAEITPEEEVRIKGPKGELSLSLPSCITLKRDDNTLNVVCNETTNFARANQGLVRSLIQNMVTGVTKGFTRTLEVNGVGFKTSVNGKLLKLSLGYSHDIDFPIPDDVSISVNGNTITVESIDKQRVGQVAAQIRALRKPEPYKGKGIKYSNETIIRKTGKTAATGGK